MGENYVKDSGKSEKSYPYFYFGALSSAFAAIFSALAYITMRKLAPFKLHMAFNGYYFGIYSTSISVVMMALFN